MKKILTALIIITAIALLPSQCLSAVKQEEMDKLLAERQSNCWVEGEMLGEMVIGSRGLIQFIYLDSKLSQAITADRTLASWLDEFNQYFGSKGTKNKAIFIVQLEAYKPWTVELEKFSIGGYHLKADDILSPSWKNPFGTVDSGTKWHFAFVVPLAGLKKGQEIAIGYGEDMIKWRVPK